jgi:hypothetical protein
MGAARGSGKLLKMPRVLDTARKARPPVAGLAAAVAGTAESAGVRDCLEWFSRERQWINERHQIGRASCRERVCQYV